MCFLFEGFDQVLVASRSHPAFLHGFDRFGWSKLIALLSLLVNCGHASHNQGRNHGPDQAVLLVLCRRCFFREFGTILQTGCQVRSKGGGLPQGSQGYLHMIDIPPPPLSSCRLPTHLLFFLVPVLFGFARDGPILLFHGLF